MHLKRCYRSIHVTSALAWPACRVSHRTVENMRVAIVTESFLPQINGVQGSGWEVIGQDLTRHYRAVA